MFIHPSIGGSNDPYILHIMGRFTSLGTSKWHLGRPAQCRPQLAKSPMHPAALQRIVSTLKRVPPSMSSFLLFGWMGATNGHSFFSKTAIVFLVQILQKNVLGDETKYLAKWLVTTPAILSPGVRKHLFLTYPNFVYITNFYPFPTSPTHNHIGTKKRSNVCIFWGPKNQHLHGPAKATTNPTRKRLHRKKPKNLP